MPPDTKRNNNHMNVTALSCIDLFLLTKDPLKFKNPFVWTTVKPLVDLLECEFDSVKLLGTFLAVVTAKAKASTTNLFMEGAVKILKDIFKNYPDHSAISKFALLALHELGITPGPQHPPHHFLETNQDISSWLESIGLSEFFPNFQKHCIMWSAVPHLTEKDLIEMEIPVGPRKKILYVINSILRGASGKFLPGPNMGDGVDCLVCCAHPREICFVPCGHVVTCETCAHILCACGAAKCIICRSVIQVVVKPFYV